MKNIIPQPVSVSPAKGVFKLSSDAKIFVPPGNSELKQIGKKLASRLSPATSFDLPIIASTGSPSNGNLFLSLGEDDPVLGAEGYELTVSPERVSLSASQPAGIFRGAQTLQQLLPPKIASSTTQPGPWTIPCGQIRDYPRYQYRGVMLDVARHFFGVEDVKRYLDLLACYKINHFHMHLTDDQGWRIEIKSWPNLAEHGGSTAVDGDPGGYYTQEEYREIVDYAKNLYITVIPEIDLPSHINAALASYPELNADGVAPELYTGIEVGFNSLVVDKEITFKFIDDVIREVAELTPGAYIHIGGDEAKVTSDEDYVEFIRRIEEIVHSHGKQMIGWDEILKSELAPTSVVQYWRFVVDETVAPENTKFIVSPANKAYLDMKYNDDTPIGYIWAGTINVQQSYEWNPVDQVAGLTEENILGVEAPLWAETLLTIEDVEFMTFPRLPGIAEVGWTPQAQRDWITYKTRLADHGPRFDYQGINYFKSPLIDW